MFKTKMMLSKGSNREGNASARVFDAREAYNRGESASVGVGGSRNDATKSNLRRA